MAYEVRRAVATALWMLIVFLLDVLAIIVLLVLSQKFKQEPW